MIELFFASAAAVPSLGGPAEIWAAIVKDFSNIGSPSALSAFLQVLMIDLPLLDAEFFLPEHFAVFCVHGGEIAGAGHIVNGKD